MEGEEIERWVQIARNALARDDARNAIESLKKALTIDPEHADAHLLLAHALLKLKRPEAALVEANQAILHSPESTYAHALLGDIQYANRNLTEAKRHYETAQTLDPHGAAPLRGLATVAAFFDDDRGARELLDKALALDPADTHTLVDLAELDLDRGRLAEAEKWAKSALEIQSEHRRALVIMGHVLLRRGDLVAAREHATWALRVDPTDSGALRLFAAIKARESFLLGTWYRVNASLVSLGPRATIVLLAAFVGQMLFRLILQDLGLPGVAAVINTVWLGICYYSYAGPALFRRMLDKELATVRLNDRF